MTRTGTKVRQMAVENLRSSDKLKSNKDLEKGIRRVVYRKQLGFRVTIGSKKRGKRGKDVWTDFSYHLNRRGQLKPVLIWAEGGTDQRYTKGQTKIFRRKRKGHYTGRMRRYGFLERTKQEASSQVEALMKEEIVKNIQRIARKYGCSVT